MTLEMGCSYGHLTLPGYYVSCVQGFYDLLLQEGFHSGNDNKFDVRCSSWLFFVD
jgi:hypothetical protein